MIFSAKYSPFHSIYRSALAERSENITYLAFEASFKNRSAKAERKVKDIDSIKNNK